MSLPPLLSAAAPSSVSASLASAEASLPAKSFAAPHAAAEVHLPALSATSLRPARLRNKAHTPSPLKAHARAASHPLLDALLSGKKDDELAEALASPSEKLPLPSMQEALTEVGGADQVEVLLQRLEDLAATQDVGEGNAGVLQCVGEVLQLPLDAVDVVPSEEDPAVLQVCLPLSTRVAQSGVGGSVPRPCLVLRLHRQRGVLALHIINLCYQGPRLREERRALREPAVVKKQHRLPNVRRTPESTAAAAAAAAAAPPVKSGLLASFATDVTTAATAQARAPPNTTVVTGLDYAQLSSMLTRPSEANSRTAEAAFTVGVDAPSKMRLAKPSDGKPKTAGKPRHGRKPRAAPPSRPHGSVPDVVEFDPLHPEQTTPFNAQHRPLTFNAAIAFS